MSGKMNVLFLFDDQHNADCLGYAGHPLVKTPHLDRLAADGVYFNNMYCCGAICGPSRTSFFTGTYLRAHGHYQNTGDLRRPIPNLVEILKTHGYHTFQAGKNHLPPAIADHFDEMHTIATYQRYAESKVRETDIRNFIGAMSGDTRKGIFVTTSTFDEKAKTKAKDAHHTIILIDGSRLVDLMHKFNVGVQIKNRYEIKAIDNDFFESEAV